MNMLKIQLYQGKRKEWRWRAKRSGRIVAESGEGYKRRATMLRTLRNTFTAIRKYAWEIE